MFKSLNFKFLSLFSCIYRRELGDLAFRFTGWLAKLIYCWVRIAIKYCKKSRVAILKTKFNGITTNGLRMKNKKKKKKKNNKKNKFLLKTGSTFLDFRFNYRLSRLLSNN